MILLHYMSQSIMTLTHVEELGKSMSLLKTLQGFNPGTSRQHSLLISKVTVKLETM